MSQTSSPTTKAYRELWAVVPAAGQGTRLPSASPKQYLDLNGRCLLQRAIDTLTQIPTITGVVVALSADDAMWPMLSASKHPKVTTTVGGATRAESVIAGLQVVQEQSNDDEAMVLVHDAARAMTSVEDVQRLIERVNVNPRHGGLLAAKVQDTLKREKIFIPFDDVEKAVQLVDGTVKRDALWQAQTPQMFQGNLLLDSLLKNKRAIDAGDITDEACAMEISGFSPALVEALDPNFKITRASDLDMAKALIERRENA